jgi:hypothetical protein
MQAVRGGGGLLRVTVMAEELGFGLSVGANRRQP